MLKRSIRYKNHSEIGLKGYLLLGTLLLIELFVISTSLIFRDVMLVAIKESNNSPQVILEGNEVRVLPITGEEDTTFNFANYPLFLAVSGFIFIVGTGGLVYLVVRRDKIGGKKRRIARITTLFGVLFLAGGVILVSYAIGNSNESVVNINAIPNDVIQTPNYTLSPTPTIALTVH